MASQDHAPHIGSVTSAHPHTPGPWVVRSDGFYPVVRKEFHPGHHMDVCGPVHGYMYSRDERGEQQANACLISAAPELLAVAKMILRTDDEWKALSMDERSRVEAAISKAEAK